VGHKFEWACKEMAVAYFMLYSRYGSAHGNSRTAHGNSRSAHAQPKIRSWSAHGHSRSAHGQITVNSRSAHGHSRSAHAQLTIRSCLAHVQENSSPQFKYIRSYERPCSRHGVLIWVQVFIYGSVCQTTLLVDPFWLPKITTDPYTFAHVNIKCPDDRYPKFLFISYN
jgi:hypothetical protein